MKKILFLLFIAVVAITLNAQNINKKELQEKHDLILKKMEDTKFLEGIHYFGVFNNLPASVYRLKSEKSLYTEYNDKKFYRVVQVRSGQKNISLLFSDLLIQDEKKFSLKYKITFIFTKGSKGYFVTFNKEQSNLNGVNNWDKIGDKILDYAHKIYPAVKKIKENQREGLQLIGPAINIWNALFNIVPAMIPVNSKSNFQSRQILTKTIYFRWSWGYSSGFKAAPIYQEMADSIIGFDSVKISTAKNAWNIRVSGTVTGNNVAKVFLANVSFMCYPTFWSSSLNGSIRCVMQK